MVDCYYNCDMLRTINGYLALLGGLDDVNITPKSQYLHRVTYGLMQKYIRTHKEEKSSKKCFSRDSFTKNWMDPSNLQSNQHTLYFLFLLESLEQCKICFKGLTSENCSMYNFSCICLSLIILPIN